ncbi:MAG: 50S ribosomal protein L9 [Candidatus Melainabacteria bacterium]|nr:50S ribosomal protein L9 [Candidatus Melainabacteria bacterium]
MANLKVVLNESVEKLGQVGDIVSVRSGYARNYLLPNEIASIPTIGEIKRLEKKRALLEEELKQEKTFAEELAAKLNKIAKIEISAKAGEAGKLFGSITSKDIVAVFEDKHDIKLQRKQVMLKRSISEVGEYNVKIKLHPEVIPEIEIVVKSEEE